MPNNNNKNFNIKKAAIPVIVAVIAIICGVVFMGDRDAFLGTGSSGYSSVVSENIPAGGSDGGSGQTSAAPQTTTTPQTTTAPKPVEESRPEKVEIKYNFRTQEQYEDHYEKHGHEFTPIFGEITMEEYLEYANALIASDAEDILTKYEEDGDFMYFRTSTEEFLVLSPDGCIRTYFIPTAGIDYWNRQ